MATLNETNGPSNTLRGMMPSLPAERDGRHHWLVFSLANVYATHTTSSDLARALVLDRLGYGHRPELAEVLDARPAAGTEIKAVCSRKRQVPLKVDARNATRIGKLARTIYVNDLRRAGEQMEGGAHHGSTKQSVQRYAAASASSDRRLK